MSNRITFIDDGLNDPVNGTTERDIKSESRNTESERTASESLGTSGIPTFDPSTVRGDYDGEPPKRRGRPKGSKNRQSSGGSDTEEKTPLHLTADLESLLISAHLMLASVTVEEMMIDPTEADRLAKALRELAKFYPMGLDPKKFAWAQFAMAIGGIYG